MKLSSIIICLLISATSIAQSKNFTGMWEGKIEMGIKLRIVFHFTKDKAGNYLSKMDSPDQAAYGMATDYTRVRNDSIFTGIDKYQVAFAGKFIDDTTINGSFKHRASIPLMLKKVSKYGTDTPQTPVQALATNQLI